MTITASKRTLRTSILPSLCQCDHCASVTMAMCHTKHAYTHTRMHPYTQTRMQTCTQIRMHTCTQTCRHVGLSTCMDKSESSERWPSSGKLRVLTLLVDAGGSRFKKLKSSGRELVWSPPVLHDLQSSRSSVVVVRPYFLTKESDT